MSSGLALQLESRQRVVLGAHALAQRLALHLLGDALLQFFLASIFIHED